MIYVNLPLLKQKFQVAALTFAIRKRPGRWARWYRALSPSRFGFSSAHDLFGIPLRSFPDHALTDEVKFSRTSPRTKSIPIKLRCNLGLIMSNRHLLPPNWGH